MVLTGTRKMDLVLNPCRCSPWKHAKKKKEKKERPYQEDRCELPRSSGQGQVLFSEDVVVTLWNGLGQRDPRLQ